MLAKGCFSVKTGFGGASYLFEQSCPILVSSGFLKYNALNNNDGNAGDDYGDVNKFTKLVQRPMSASLQRILAGRWKGGRGERGVGMGGVVVIVRSFADMGGQQGWEGGGDKE